MGADSSTCTSADCHEAILKGQIIGIVIFAAYAALFIICLVVAVMHSHCCGKPVLQEIVVEVDAIPLLNMSDEDRQ